LWDVDVISSRDSFGLLVLSSHSSKPEAAIHVHRPIEGRNCQRRRLCYWLGWLVLKGLGKSLEVVEEGMQTAGWCKQRSLLVRIHWLPPCVQVIISPILVVLLEI
jgi:hypothetical protein